MASASTSKVIQACSSPTTSGSPRPITRSMTAAQTSPCESPPYNFRKPKAYHQKHNSCTNFTMWKPRT
uniref:Uncharacterized protein n=1 Tax=Arundo donax TaxID=35708 RepID=A0A0A9H9C9_ARUDO